MSDVYVKECPTYQRDLVESAIQDIFTDLGGVNRLVNPDQTVLLKVNLLSPTSPDKAVTTHPELVRAVAKQFIELGARVLVGDSSAGIIPKGNRTATALKISGIESVCQDVGAEVVNFDTVKSVELANPRGENFESIFIAQPLYDADLVVTLPKLKTHSLTLFTGAVKNMYGSVPGGRKAYYHRIAPRPQEFSQYLVDIFSVTKPGLAIMDGIVGMEGDGPSAGTPCQLGIILASQDSVALDASACRLVGINPQAVTMLKEAQARQLGEIAQDKIIIHGPFNHLRPKRFKARKHEIRLPLGLAKLVFGGLYTYPLIDPAKCVNCKICQTSCPVQTIYDGEGGVPVIEQTDCIQCYCCHELCPQTAIDLKSSWLVRVLRKMGR